MSVLHNAAKVLRLFATGCTNLTVSEVSTRLDIPKANASRLLKSMRDAQMLETIGDTRRHRPGRLMLDLAGAFRNSSSLISRAGEVVADVSQRFGHTGYVALRDGCEVSAVADFPGTNALRVVSNIGRRLPAHKSATGRSLLARLSDQEILQLYSGHPQVDELLARIAGDRKNGYVYSSQEATRGVDSVAIAVADPGTDETVSLCSVFPHSTVDCKGRNELLAALAHGASQIAQELGDVAFATPLILDKGPIE